MIVISFQRFVASSSLVTTGAGGDWAAAHLVHRVLDTGARVLVPPRPGPTRVPVSAGAGARVAVPHVELGKNI